MVGSNHKGPNGCGPPTQSHFGTGLACPVDEPFDAREVVFVDERSDTCSEVSRVADRKARQRRQDPFEQLVCDRLLDEQTSTGEADLTGVDELATDLSSGRVEVGVSEDQER